MRIALITTVLLAAAWPLAAQTAADAPRTWSTEIFIDDVSGNTITYMESRLVTVDDPAAFRITDCNGTAINKVSEIPFPSRARITFAGDDEKQKPVGLELLIVYRINPANDKLEPVRWDSKWDDFVRHEVH